MAFPHGFAQQNIHALSTRSPAAQGMNLLPLLCLHAGMHPRRCVPVQGTVWTLMVIKFKVIDEPLCQLGNTLVVIEIDVLIFNTSPEPFYKYIVQCPASLPSILMSISRSSSFCVKTGLVNWLP